MIRALPLLPLLLMLLACGRPEQIGREMCFRQCETEQRTYEAIEACRARCRDAYRPDIEPGATG